MNGNLSFVRTIGSLWFAAVLLMLLLVAMACATVFESGHGPEHALAAFYKSWWFIVLLGLLAVNVLAAVIVRFPFSKRQIGFVLTHAAILLILGGSLLTNRYGVDGQVVLAENQTVRELTLFGHPALTIAGRGGKTPTTLDLDPAIFESFETVAQPPVEPLTAGGLRVEIVQYLPDSEESQQIVDDNPRSQPAVEVAFSESGLDHPEWILAGQPGTAGGVGVALTIVATSEELQRLVSKMPSPKSDSKGTVKIQYEGRDFAFPLEQCTEAPMSIGDTGYSLRVTRYLPHAIVGSGGEIVNASPKAENPYIEAELVGPGGTETKRAFARFPDHDSIHGSQPAQGLLRLRFEAETDAAPAAPVEILTGPDNKMYARFSPRGAVVQTTQIDVGTTVGTPWPDRKLTVLRRFEHARWDRTVVPLSKVRKEGRRPALRVKLSTDKHANEMWVQRDHSYPVSVDGLPYEVYFGNKSIPLGFDLTLNKFRLGTYPGTHRPRSFESHITINDPRSGERSAVVSMNNPAEHGGLTFYQSSYFPDRNKYATVLSVSRDPGQMLVFAGYILMFVGMVWVLAQRMRDRHVPQAQSVSARDRRAHLSALPARNAAGTPRYG